MKKTWIKWVLGHVVVFPVAFLFGFIAIHLFSFIGNLLPEIIASGLGYILWGGIIGCSIGFVQWRFLRKNAIPKAWIWRSAMGIAIGETIVVAFLLLLDIDRNFDLALTNGMVVWAVAYFIGGATSGYLQSRYLRINYPKFKYWIVGNSAVWGVSTLLWTGLIKVLPSAALFMLIFGGLFLGILSALVLQRLIKVTL